MDPIDKNLEGVDMTMMLTIDDVAAQCRVHTSTVRNWVETGEFPAPIKIGRSKRWLMSDVIQWISDRNNKRGCNS